MTSLPQASSSTAYVDISLIPTGVLSLPDNFLHKNGNPDKIDVVPDYAFLIEHKASGKKIFFDLGIHNDLDIYTPRAKDLFDWFKPVPPKQSLAEQISEKKGISADEITQVIFSHLHWDHCHSFSSYLPKATALFGPGSIDHAKPGYPTTSDTAYFSELVDHNHPWHKNVEELPSAKDKGWKPFSTFERGWDLLGDGSFWIIDAPGHVPGNIAAAGRLKDGEWIVMGGDCAHSKELIQGICEIGTWKDDNGNDQCMHGDIEAAKDTMRRLRQLGEMEGVYLALAHVSIDELDDNKLKELRI